MEKPISEKKLENLKSMWSSLRPKLEQRGLSNEQIGCVALYMLGFYYHSGSPTRIAEKVSSLKEASFDGKNYTVNFFEKETFTIKKETFDSFTIDQDLAHLLMDEAHLYFGVHPRSLQPATNEEKRASAAAIVNTVQKKQQR